jgi:hypothetical protein
MWYRSSHHQFVGKPILLKEWEDSSGSRKQTKEDNPYKPPPPFLPSIGNTRRNRKPKAPPRKQKKEKKAPKRDQDKRKKKALVTLRTLHTEKKTVHCGDKHSIPSSSSPRTKKEESRTRGRVSSDPSPHSTARNVNRAFLDPVFRCVNQSLFRPPV